MRRPLSLLTFLFLLLTTAAFGDRIDREREPGLRMILETQGPLTDQDRAELAAKGIQVRHALRGNEYLARVAAGATVDDARVKALGPIRAEDKIDSVAWREAARGTAMEVHVLFHDDVTFDQARSALLSSGAALADPLSLHFGPLHRIRAKVSPAMLTALAADDRVFGVLGVRHFRAETHNARSAAASHVTELYSAPYNLTGAGVSVSLFELAQGQQDHVEFGTRHTVFGTGGGSSEKEHATHVAGTIGAAGIRADAKGMAPEAKLYQFCISTPCGSANLTFLDDKDEKLKPLGVTIDNNSWGFVLGWTFEDFPVWNDFDEYWGAYDLTLAAPEDEISIEKGILFVHSAGNDGTSPGFFDFSQHRHVNDDGDTITDKVFCYSVNGSGTDCPAGAQCNGGCETVKHHTQVPFDTIGVTASAKNGLTVAAVAVANDGTKFVASFSSRGPAKDGRVKPDVSARGTLVLSTVPTNNYGSKNGTSMASPAVAGIAAILTEQWRRTFGSSPTPEQLRAVIIAGADDLGNPGPDYTYGFGFVNAKTSADLIIADAAQGKSIRNLSLSQGQSAELAIGVSAGQKVRVVLNWADPAIPFLPGRPDIATKALVNDLDVKVITPTGATVLPYVLNKDDFNANATTGVNTVDNTEMLEIPAATAGVYRVVVTGTSVTEGPQTAVLVTNAVVAPPCKDLTEGNDTEAGAYGNLVPTQSVDAAICSAGDVDFFKFFQAVPGQVHVTITTGDTPLRFTLSGAASQTIEVPASSTATLTANASVGTVLVKVEATAAPGLNPSYTFTPEFTQPTAPKRRSTRH